LPTQFTKKTGAQWILMSLQYLFQRVGQLVVLMCLIMCAPDKLPGHTPCTLAVQPHTCMY